MTLCTEREKGEKEEERERREREREREGGRERGGGGIASFHSRSVYRSQNIPETPKHLRVQ